MFLGAVCLATTQASSLSVDVDVALAKQYFAEARAASERDGGKLWGLPIVQALLFVDPDTKHCVANEPDVEHLLSAQDGAWIGQLPADTAIANTSFDFGGKSYAMVMWPLPAEKAARVALMVHESWHRIQATLGLPSNSAFGAHLSETNARIWFRLELRALAAALKGADEIARIAAGDAIVFRRMRNAQFADAEASETGLERHEGLAEYTGDRVAFIEDKALVDRVVNELCAFEREESMGRSFAYRTGPAYGVLLDRFRPSWRDDLKSGKGPAQLLAEALGRDWAGKPDGAGIPEAKYGGPDIRKEETERAEARAKRILELRRLLIEGQVLDIGLTKPNMSFDPGTVSSLGSDGEAYRVLRIIDEWGEVEVSGGSGLLTNWKRLRVGLPEGFDDGARSGTGWTIQLNPGWKLVPGARKGDWTVRKP